MAMSEHHARDEVQRLERMLHHARLQLTLAVDRDRGEDEPVQPDNRSAMPMRRNARDWLTNRANSLRLEAQAIDNLLKSLPQEMPPEAEDALLALLGGR